FVQARITHLTQRMGELSKIDVSTIATDRAGFGSKLRLRNLETGDEVEYTIVTGDYMDIEAGHISLESPIGRAVLGRAEGDELEVQLPRGEVRFRVEELTTLPEMVD
ncbi:MAG: GreA/GreB family elongation factor, partial [Gemmatimonadota bacterium]